MVAIKKGDFIMGSNEKGESPKHKVKISAFWMASKETSWLYFNNYYRSYYNWLDENRKLKKSQKNPLVLVSTPTPPYLDMSFGMGQKDRPVVSITQLAARCYCMWLSAKTGHFYRLPTEAEWEYACRAGTKTKYFFGDDKKLLKQYAWYDGNSDFEYQKLATKKPNPWGLYDMYGNASEWCLDSYAPYTKNSMKDPLNQVRKGTNSGAEREWPFKIYGRVVRGGSWDSFAKDCRSSGREKSLDKWKAQDAQITKSIWWLGHPYVGFRVIRTEFPAYKDLFKYWPTDEEIRLSEPD
jgi:formylglycine-generating enzyme required for sulfatase activity